MSNVIVTGGGGFIGSHLVNKLCDNHNVRVIDSFTYAGRLENVDKRAKVLWADIRNPAEIGHIDFEKVDVLYHLAAESHVDNSIKNPNIFVETNVIGTVNLLNACKDKGVKFIHVSTDEVYGDLKLEEDPFMEGTPFDPSSPYSASKASSDHFVSAYARTYGMDNIITHCSNNYGPRQHREKLIPKVIDSIKNNKPIPVYGDGTNVRDWIYVEDHCDALIYIAEHGDGETYNIGGENELTNIEIINLIAYEMGNPPIIEFVEDRKGHDKRYAINNLKINMLGWKPETSFTEGLIKTIRYFDE